MSSVTVEPAYDQWKTILSANRERVGAFATRCGPHLFRQLRDDIVAEAQRYSDEIRTIAADAAISLRSSANTHHEGRIGPLVMAGHQPVVYHPGLLFKSTMLSRLTRATAAQGVLVVIDSDQGDGGVITWPCVREGSLEIKRRSIAVGEGELFCHQRVASSHVVREIFQEITLDLKQAGLESEANQLAVFGRAYEVLAGRSLAAAHTIVRWMVEESCYNEVPLMRLIAHTPLRDLLAALVSDGLRLAEVYNATLNSYRKEHRIENSANPFPNVKSGPEGQELPLWVIDERGRLPLYLSHDASFVCKDTARLCPRGSITTFLLRAYCSDIFIHGVGGARYDTFVDAFAEKYTGLPLPRFVVASETRHLFPQEVARLGREVELASQLKEMISRTERYLGKGIFQDAEENELAMIVKTRETLRAALQGAESPEQRSRHAHELNAANKAVRAIIENGSLKGIISRAAANEAALSRWSFREFPYFLFNDSGGVATDPDSGSPLDSVKPV